MFDRATITLGIGPHSSWGCCESHRVHLLSVAGIFEITVFIILHSTVYIGAQLFMLLLFLNVCALLFQFCSQMHIGFSMVYCTQVIFQCVSLVQNLFCFIPVIFSFLGFLERPREHLLNQ